MIENYMLYKNIPELDLHGENRFTGVLLANEFINDNQKLGNNLVKIVHGIGTGILKEEIHKFLKHNKKVLAYKIDIFNQGVTIVEIISIKKQK